MITYELKIHSRDIANLSDPIDIAKHTGYDLITYIDGKPVNIKSIDLYGDNGKIKFCIKNQFVIQDIYKSIGEAVGMYMLYDGINTIMTSQWLMDMEYETSVLLANNDALKAFNKIKLEASILNYFSDKLDYEVLGKNCNSSTKYFADKYLNGVDVFAGLDGAYVGNNYDFTKDNIGAGPTNIDNESIKKVSEVLDKFYSLLEESGHEFDYENFDVHVEHKNDGWYLKITDGVKNYIFDDDYNSSITDGNLDSIIYLGNGRNVVNSGGGNDIIYGGDGVDVVHAGSGDDIIETGGGNDIIFGGSGINYIDPGGGNNEIYCEAA